MDSVKSIFFQIIKRKETLLYLLIFIAGLTIVGWLLNNVSLSAFSSKYKPISPLVSITFISLSIILILTTVSKTSQLLRTIARFSLIIVLLYYILIFLGYFFNFGFNIESIFYINLDRYGTALTGYMSPIASVLFISTCVSILSFSQNISNVIKYVGGGLSLLVSFTSTVLLIGYFYSAPLLYGSTIIPVALPAAICFLLLSITLLRLYGSKYWTFNLIKGNKITFQILKLFLPVTVFIVILTGYIESTFAFNDINPTLTSAIIIIFAVIITTIVIFRISSGLGNELMRAEEAISESNTKFLSLANNIDGYVAFVNANSSKYEFVNDMYEKSFGISKGEIIGSHFKDIVGETNYKATLKEFEKVKAGKIVSYESNLDIASEKRWLQVNFIPVTDASGQVISIGVINFDITDRKKVEAELTESNIFIKSLIETIPFAMDVVDETGCILFQNDNFKSIFGDSAIGSKCWEVYKDDKKKCTDCPLNIGITIGKTETTESDGALGNKSFEIFHTGMMFQGKKAMLEIFHDITERKERDKELLRAKGKVEESEKQLFKLVADKDRFISILAHDLRSPFNSLIGISEELIENIQEYHIDEIKNMADDINITAQSTFDLLEELLMWARTQQGKILFKPKKYGLIDIWNDTIEVLRSSATAKRIELNINTSSGVTVYADIFMLKTVLRNLVSNAIKFTKNGGAINIRTEEDPENVIISVSDNGVGITSDNMEKLFDISEVISTKGTTGEKGTGLGLLLCKEFVEKHGGKIWVESELGNGSTFYITIPNKDAPDEVGVVENIASADGDSIVTKLKILIAEDDKAASMFLGISVKKIAKEIIYAQNGLEAVMAYRNNPDIDLILMDIKMPEMDGFEATRQIRQLSRDIIIIVQSAYTDPDEREKAKEAGCNDFISKPIKKTLLLELINRHCNN